MKTKIVITLAVMLLVATILPTAIAIEAKTQDNGELGTKVFCDVTIKGKGTEKILMGSFVLGFGRCAYMKVDLEEDGYIKIHSVGNSSNEVILEGSHQIILFGFVGYYSHLIKTRINGYALFAIWS